MTNLKAMMFNRRASHRRSNPDQILDALALKQGQAIADIGAGGGYFTLRFAETVGTEGRVYAADTDQSLLRSIENNAKQEGLNNIQTILVTEKNLTLPERSLDLIFMRNVCHHLEDRVEYFKRLKSALKPEGRVAIIEYRRSNDFTFRGLFQHYVPRETIIEEMKKAGYRVEEEFDFLSEQSFTTFTAQEKNNR